MIAVGDELWVEYDEPPPRLAHKRMVVGVSAAFPEHFAVLSPDFDVFVEECDAANTDIRNWWKHWPGGAPAGAAVLPGGIRRYDFAAVPSPAQIAQACALGAARLAAHDRLPALGGPAPPDGAGAGGALVARAPDGGALGGGVAAMAPDRNPMGPIATFWHRSQPVVIRPFRLR